MQAQYRSHHHHMCPCLNHIHPHLLHPAILGPHVTIPSRLTPLITAIHRISGFNHYLDRILQLSAPRPQVNRGHTGGRRTPQLGAMVGSRMMVPPRRSVHELMHCKAVLQFIPPPNWEILLHHPVHVLVAMLGC